MGTSAFIHRTELRRLSSEKMTPSKLLLALALASIGLIEPSPMAEMSEDYERHDECPYLLKWLQLTIPQLSKGRPPSEIPYLLELQLPTNRLPANDKPQPASTTTGGDAAQASAITVTSLEVT